MFNVPGMEKDVREIWLMWGLKDCGLSEEGKASQGSEFQSLDPNEPIYYSNIIIKNNIKLSS